jgi:NADPH:quinone reductase-like Zn-dependent oxidoreductase
MLAGKMKVALAKIFPLAEAAEAHRLLQSRSAIGKILLAA